LEDLGMKHYENTGEVLYKETFTAVKAALEAKDEPVAWIDERAIAWLVEHPHGNITTKLELQKSFERPMPLYTTPPQQKAKDEPVAWRYKSEPSFDGNKWHDTYELTASKQVALWKDKDAKPLYTTPPQRKPLTDEAIATVYWGATGQSLRPQDNVLAHNFARAIEAAHGIKGEE
jgi:hypothetical protein